MADIHLLPAELQPPARPSRRHLLSIGDLGRDDIGRLLATAQNFAGRETKKGSPVIPAVAGPPTVFPRSL